MTRALPCLAVALALGCGEELPGAPALGAVEPASARNDAPVRLRVTGTGFVRRFKVDLDDPAATTPLGAHSLSLVEGELTVALADVTLVSESEIQATVPAASPPGTFALRLVDPWGRAASLPAAFAVTAVTAGCTPDPTCADGIACTTDRCVDSVCRNDVAPGSCLIEGACRSALAVDPENPCHRCDPARAPAAWTAVQNGTPCTDLDLCTQGETCQEGACGSAIYITPCPSGACFVGGSCDPETGRCARAPRPDTTPCDDQYGCTSPDTCAAGECRGPSSCGNTAPLACLVASPASVGPGGAVTLDASCSRDMEDAGTSLVARFDLDGDGAFDTPFSPVLSRTFTPTQYGMQAATVEVRDPAGVSGFATRQVFLAGAADVVVTTPADEEDTDASPAAPGGTGLSLREAILHVNQSDVARAIRFLAPMTIRPTSALPKLRADGAALAGGPGVVLDFSALPTASGACLSLFGQNQRLLALEMHSCPDQILHVGAGAVVADCRLRRGTQPGGGLQIAGDGAALVRVEIADFDGPGVEITRPAARVEGCRVHHNGGAGIQLTAGGDGALLQQNVIDHNAGAGISLPNNHFEAVVRFNTFDAQSADGVATGNSAGGLFVRDNLFTRHGGSALCGPAAAYGSREPNGLFGNAGLFCAGSPGPTSVLVDPLYLAPQIGDYRLRPGSPARDAGTDVGLDVNGPFPGAWNGLGPDLGAHETP